MWRLSRAKFQVAQADQPPALGDRELTPSLAGCIETGSIQEGLSGWWPRECPRPLVRSPLGQLDLWSRLQVSQTGQQVSGAPTSLSILFGDAQAGPGLLLLQQTPISRKHFKLGGGAGRRKNSNYRADGGTSRKGHSTQRRPMWKEGGWTGTAILAA